MNNLQETILMAEGKHMDEVGETGRQSSILYVSPNLPELISFLVKQKLMLK